MVKRDQLVLLAKMENLDCVDHVVLPVKQDLLVYEEKAVRMVRMEDRAHEDAKATLVVLDKLVRLEQKEKRVNPDQQETME
uniref:hypothetical protein n=1 Tax=Salmonella sp. s54925 TaxID=3159674 RepID=UPI00397FB644